MDFKAAAGDDRSTGESIAVLIANDRPPSLGSSPVPQDENFHFYRYLLALSEVQSEPETSPGLRAGDLRRGANGAFWIFDGERWLEW